MPEELELLPELVVVLPVLLVELLPEPEVVLPLLVVLPEPVFQQLGHVLDPEASAAARVPAYAFFMPEQVA